MVDPFQNDLYHKSLMLLSRESFKKGCLNFAAEVVVLSIAWLNLVNAYQQAFVF